MISNLINQYNPETGKVPFKWTNRIGVYYMPFLEAIYLSPKAKTIAIKRKLPLFKYWAKNNVQTSEQAKASIPICKYCNQYPVLPKVTSNGMLNYSCHQPECNKKNVYENTKKSVQKKYGVDNISSLDSVKDLKRHIQKANHKARGLEITKKRMATVKDKYGVTNVSKLNQVKEKKAKTFTDNYGIDNIFKRSDLMKKIWTKTLGSDNPKHVSSINVERVRNSVQGQIRDRGMYANIANHQFGLLHPFEGELLRCLTSVIRPSRISTNEWVFERLIEGKSSASVIDIAVDERVFIEVKYGTHYFNNEDIDKILDIADLSDGKLYIYFIHVNCGQIMLVLNERKIRQCYYYNLSQDHVRGIIGSIDISMVQNVLLYRHFLDRVISAISKSALKSNTQIKGFIPSELFLDEVKYEKTISSITKEDRFKYIRNALLPDLNITKFDQFIEPAKLDINPSKISI